MENSENLRINFKHKKKLIDPKKCRTKSLSHNHSKQTVDNEIPQQNKIPKDLPVNPKQDLVPIMQSQYYPAQPQLMPNSSPNMVNMTGQVQIPNTYISNQISPGVNVPIKYHIKKDIEIDSEICPYCHLKTHPEIKEHCNCCTCFFYTIFVCLFPILFGYYIYSFCCEEGCNCKGCCDCDCDCDCDCKCCIDSDYYCTKCGKIIENKRNTCHELCSCFNCCNCLW